MATNGLANQGSNNKQKLLRRIARSRPDILDRYEKGLVDRALKGATGWPAPFGACCNEPRSTRLHVVAGVKA